MAGDRHKAAEETGDMAQGQARPVEAQGLEPGTSEAGVPQTVEEDALLREARWAELPRPGEGEGERRLGLVVGTQGERIQQPPSAVLPDADRGGPAGRNLASGRGE